MNFGAIINTAIRPAIWNANTGEYFLYKVSLPAVVTVKYAKNDGMIRNIKYVHI